MQLRRPGKDNMFVGVRKRVIVRAMRKASFFTRYATFALLTFLVARVCFASALPRHEYQVEPDRATFLRFGQALALADFDGDNRVDEAKLGGTGRNKSIEIRLTHAKAPTFLSFDTLTSERGSLFARDIDNDGDNDLIWSDLLHPDDVVIWLDDGSGRFERVCPDAYAAGEFVISDAPGLDGSEIPHQDFAFSPRHDPSQDLSTAHGICDSARNPIFISRWLRVPVQAGILGTPFDRGPPSLR
jgi:hypothetical protein